MQGVRVSRKPLTSIDYLAPMCSLGRAFRPSPPTHTLHKHNRLTFNCICSGPGFVIEIIVEASAPGIVALCRIRGIYIRYEFAAGAQLVSSSGAGCPSMNNEISSCNQEEVFVLPSMFINQQSKWPRKPRGNLTWMLMFIPRIPDPKKRKV